MSTHINYDLLGPGREEIGSFILKATRGRKRYPWLFWFFGTLAVIVITRLLHESLLASSVTLSDSVAGGVFLILISIVVIVGFLLRLSMEFRGYDKGTGLMAVCLRKRVFLPLPYDEYSVESPDGTVLGVIVPRWDWGLLARRLDLYSSKGLAGDFILSLKERSLISALFHRLTFGLRRRSSPRAYHFIDHSGRVLGNVRQILDWEFWYQVDLTPDEMGLIDRRVAVMLAVLILSDDKPKFNKS